MSGNSKYTFKEIIGTNQLMERIKKAFPDDTILKCHVFFLSKKCRYQKWNDDSKNTIQFMPTTIFVRTIDAKKKFPTDGLALRFTESKTRTVDFEEVQVLEIDGTQKTYNGFDYYPSKLIHPNWQSVFEKIVAKYGDMPLFSFKLKDEPPKSDDDYSDNDDV